ncbi:MAG: AAA family ATPase [Verrucomicrobia bacterium]|nr:AAA family ATPase [Verrucomicrobiota bacterium]
MRLLHFIEIENFKRFGGIQRIELDHPAVLIGPNNCGKTSAIQAIALWSQAIKTWWDAKQETTAKERPATALNRLAITAVPVQKTRYFWHNTRVHSGKENIPMSIAVGLFWKGQVVPVKLKFSHQGDELIYCAPDEASRADLELLKQAAGINVELLYPMSGLITEEPVLKAGRINVLLGQGETAQVLRNLCLMVARDSSGSWRRIVELMRRLFSVDLGQPEETARGAIELYYEQQGVKQKLDVAVAGRGFQQLLLIFAYLYSHQGSVLLIDEPDAHLEILRQKQVYVLLREIAHENNSQVVLVTHSEIILDEALDHNLTLLLEGKSEDLAAKADIRNALKHYGAEHYVKARERGYVLYVEGSTDLDMLRALAARIDHPVAKVWDERINAYYVQDNFPETSVESELERVEGGFGVTPKKHFQSLRGLMPHLRGAAILDNDGKGRFGSNEGGLNMTYWRRYEVENYFVTPELLAAFATEAYQDMELFNGQRQAIQEVLDQLILEKVFDGSEGDFRIYRKAQPEVARLIWETKSERRKLSAFAEEFFRRLAERISLPMLCRKGELHRLIAKVDPNHIPAEVSEKLDVLEAVFQSAIPPESETTGA